MSYDPLVLLCRAHRLPAPQAEYRFLAHRRFRFDWAWPDRLLAVEQNGGVWTGGRHTRGTGYLRDLEKLNLAQLEGWTVLQFSPEQIRTAELLPLLKKALLA